MRMAKGGSGRPESKPVSRNFSWTSCWLDDEGGASPAIRVWPADNENHTTQSFKVDIIVKPI